MGQTRRNILQEIAEARKGYKPCLDSHGQPLNRLYSEKRLNDRFVDELIGISRGVLADEIVNHDEANFILRWMDTNAVYCRDPIINKIYRRIGRMLSDDVFDEEEQQELMEILAMFTGEKLSTTETKANISSSLPLDYPLPQIEFEDFTFCLTGKFFFGPRRACHDAIVDRGGKIKTSVSPLIDFLVIGGIGSSDWIHTPYGRKIEKAAELRDQGKKIAIVSEDHWAHTAFSDEV